ncbi:hypothetical protein IFR05_002466 [Cadophora sp. M221]|nr:hypothetical protein IFR05_002466 [Cadophora sp. M221]
MDRHEDSKALRSQQNQAVRAKAPIAAEFEDCIQSFDRLCATIRVNEPGPDEAVIAEDCRSRLTLWGHESGASGRKLDHALRRSFSLRTATLELLRDLQATLQGANEELTTHPRESTEQMIDFVDSVSSSTEEVDINDGQILGDNAQQSLEDIREIVNDLATLLPSLRNPAPEDLFHPDLSSQDVRQDIEAAIALSPKAPLPLSERLGIANWRRRQRIGDAGLQLSPSNRDTTDTADINLPSSDIEVRGGRPSESTKQMSYHERRTRSRVASDAGGSTAASHVETIFSRTTFFDGHSVTSIAESEGPHIPTLLMPPEPPINLELGSCFTCPYCQLEIVVGDQVTTKEDWINHVWLDLEPYLCTFDSCIRADKAFGIREEWFRHELDCHRIQKVWFCKALKCRRDFTTRSLFEDHLNSAHRTMFKPSQLSFMIDNCERHSQAPLPMQTCPLCGNLCHDAKSLKQHISDHLEQLALTSIRRGANSGGDEDGRETRGGGGLENNRAEFRLDEFVEDQFELLGLRDRGRDIILNENGGVQKASSITDENPASGGSNDSVELQNSNSCNTDEDPPSDEPKRHRNGLWVDKVDAFLCKQTNTDVSNAEIVATATIRSNTPPRDDSFVGREDDLDKIRKLLSSPGHVCVLSGCGGVGKTSTANEYSHLYEKDHSFVFWVEAETTGGCADTYNLISTPLKIDCEVIRDQDCINLLIRESLQQTANRWLLVFDNVEDWTEISQYIPENMSKTRGSVLITTRKHDLLGPTPRKNFHSLAMSAFSVEEGRQLLLCSMQPGLTNATLRSHAEYSLAGKASRLVEGLPLAISMIAGYVKVSRTSLAEFLEIWEERQSRSKATNKGMEASSVDTSINILWDIGIRELSAAARNLLDILIFLDPETIQKDLLVGDHTEVALEFLNSGETIRYKRMIAELSGRRLVTLKEKEGKQTLSIHRLLQQKIRDDLDPKQFTDVFEKAYCLVRKRYPVASPIQVPEQHNWPDCKSYTPHVLSIWRAFKKNGSLIKPTISMAQMFYDAGFHSWERQINPSDGITYLETAEEILNILNADKDKKLRADIHCVLAMIFVNFGTGRQPEILRRRKEAIRIRKAVYEQYPGDSNSDVLLANAANDFGLSLLETYSFEEAGMIFETCYKRYCCWGTEDQWPYEYGKYYINTAKVRMWQGRYSDAIRLARRGVELAEKASGKTWKYFSFQFILAYVLLQSGDLQAAFDLHLEIFQARKEVCGKHDLTTVLSNYAVGAMYHHLGDLPAAAVSKEPPKLLDYQTMRSNRLQAEHAFI